MSLMEEVMSSNTVKAATAPRCDRAEYIEWCNGVLLDRKGGQCLIVNTAAARAADAALKAMSVVVLTQDGVPLTVLVPAEGVIREHTIDTWLKEQ